MSSNHTDLPAFIEIRSSCDPDEITLVATANASVEQLMSALDFSAERLLAIHRERNAINDLIRQRSFDWMDR